MDVPKIFQPDKESKVKIKNLQTKKKNEVKSITDLVLEDRIPYEYLIDYSLILDKEKDISDLRQTYNFMLPLDDIQSIFRISYKCASLDDDSWEIRVDVFKFKDKDFISERVERFYHMKSKLNSMATSQWKYEMLIKDKYVVFFRSLQSLDHVLSRFIQEYKTSFEMKKVGFVLE